MGSRKRVFSKRQFVDDNEGDGSDIVSDAIGSSRSDSILASSPLRLDGDDYTPATQRSRGRGFSQFNPFSGRGRGGGGRGRGASGNTSFIHGPIVQTATHYRVLTVDELVSSTHNLNSDNRLTTYTKKTDSQNTSNEENSQSSEESGSGSLSQSKKRRLNPEIDPPSEIGGNNDPYNAPRLDSLTKTQIKKIMGVDQGPLMCFGCRFVGEKHSAMEDTNLDNFIAFLSNVSTSNLDQHSVNCSHFYTLTIQKPANASLEESGDTESEPLPPWNPLTIKNHLLYHNADPTIFQLLFAAKAKSITLYTLDNSVIKHKITCKVTIPAKKIGGYNTNQEERPVGFILPPTVNLAELLLAEFFESDNMVLVSPTLLETYNKHLDLDFTNLKPSQLLDLCEGVASMTTDSIVDHDVIKSVKDLMAIYLPFSKIDTTKMLPSFEREKPRVTAKLGPVDFDRKKITNESMFCWNSFYVQKKISSDNVTEEVHTSGQIGEGGKNRHLIGGNSGFSGGEKSMAGFNSPLNVNNVGKGARLGV